MPGRTLKYREYDLAGTTIARIQPADASWQQLL